ncbi:hypothetical protein M1L60_10915 [Actinoplanes sp. TRM 88003]|uniref:Gram-positive cocci surface proteins LPxTG domain-containing protein n=1 Tax=Paractinoplanes aksuensis TaxID=2939490 RepID=A0ABT1DJT7_9ACTN|nr:hypothetical protein [Actinoplanes aksuensis]MCO8271104.1 hypothetical protein [Actinoplanes aksuensis]
MSTLDDSQTETDRSDNSDNWSLTVTGVNQANFTALGATGRAAVGKTVTVRVGVRNNGPARIEGWGSPQGSYLIVTVVPPTGTTVVNDSPFCGPFPTIIPDPIPPFPGDGHPDDGKYYCYTPAAEGVPYAPGRTVLFDFVLRVDQPGTLRGSIKITRGGPPPAGDPDPSDDIAPIVINAATATPGGGEGGGLPITGTNSTAIALIGLALVIAGAAARVIATRR